MAKLAFCASVLFCLASALVAGTGEAPPSLRLPGSAHPVRYRVDLTVQPGRERMEGRIRIDITIPRRTRDLWLNARDLAITRAEFTPLGGSPLACEVIPENHLHAPLRPRGRAGQAPSGPAALPPLGIRGLTRPPLAHSAEDPVPCPRA